jgi:hypothetical protein
MVWMMTDPLDVKPTAQQVEDVTQATASRGAPVGTEVAWFDQVAPPSDVVMTAVSYLLLLKTTPTATQ